MLYMLMLNNMERMTVALPAVVILNVCLSALCLIAAAAAALKHPLSLCAQLDCALRRVPELDGMRNRV